MILYKHATSNWNYLFVRIPNKRNCLVFTRDVVLEGVKHSVRGKVKDVRFGYPIHDTKFFDEMETQKHWLRVENIFTKLWVMWRLFRDRRYSF